MANGITGFDHSLVGVRDLEAARDVWRRLGFVVTPRGRHIGWGTANYCIMFAANYVELLGMVDPTQYVAGLDVQLAERGEGLLRLALATADADAAHAELVGHGLGPEPVRDLKRELELPEGTVLPRFKTMNLPADTLPGLPLFLCQHLSPDLVRRPAWLQHPNAAIGLAGMTVVVDDPPALREAAEKLFGDGSANLTDDTLTIITGDSALMFVRPEDVESMHPEVAPANPRPPHLLAMTFRVADVARAALALTANKVPFRRGLDDVLRVAPAEANGVLVEFAA